MCIIPVLKQLYHQSAHHAQGKQWKTSKQYHELVVGGNCKQWLRHFSGKYKTFLDEKADKNTSPIMDRCRVSASMASDFTESLPATGLRSTGIIPIVSSSGTSPVSISLWVYPLRAAQLMRMIPNTTAPSIPAVALASAKSFPAFQFSLSKVGASPPAVPWPPSNPTGMIAPNMAGSSGQNTWINARKSPIPTRYCPHATICP